MNLADELTNKALIFQLNNFNEEFINSTLTKNKEGIFNLPNAMDKSEQKEIVSYLLSNYGFYSFELRDEFINSRIYFQYQSSI
jgi:hypothetical protein